MSYSGHWRAKKGGPIDPNTVWQRHHRMWACARMTHWSPSGLARTLENMLGSTMLLASAYPILFYRSAI